jgi:O-antigen ligase
MTERMETAVFRTAAIIVPALAPLGPRATAPILVAAAVALAASSFVRRKPPRLPHVLIWGGVAVLSLWAGITLFWALGQAWRPWTMLVGGFVCGSVLLGAARGIQIGRWLSAGIWLGGFVYAFEVLSGAWLTRLVHGFAWRDIIDDVTGGTSVQAYLINGTVILSLMLWPAVGLLVQRQCRIEALSTIFVVLCVVLAYGSDTGIVALALGALAWEMTARFGKRVIHWAAALFAVVVLLTPLTLHQMLSPRDLERLAVDHQEVPNSALVRLFIWKFAVDRIVERPLLGWGFDAARRIPGGSDPIAVQSREGRARINELNLPLHPHNQVLQIWLELGAVGAIIVAVAGSLVLWRLGSRPPPVNSSGAALARS